MSRVAQPAQPSALPPPFVPQTQAASAGPRGSSMEDDGYDSSGARSVADGGAIEEEEFEGLGEEEEDASDSPRTQMIKANIRVVRAGGQSAAVVGLRGRSDAGGGSSGGTGGWGAPTGQNRAALPPQFLICAWPAPTSASPSAAPHAIPSYLLARWRVCPLRSVWTANGAPRPAPTIALDTGACGG